MEERGSLDVLAVIERVFTLYKDYGGSNYMGESVSSLQHALQAGHSAQSANSSEEEVIGALLHDIGHLIGTMGMASTENQTQYKEMDGCGIMGHEHIGAQYLRKAGFSRGVVEMCCGHVAAKRYLCYKDTEYFNRLSETSKVTLGFQGGPMTSSEAKEFEANPYCLAILKVRSYDEAAKVPDKVVPDLESYRNMMIRNIMSSKDGLL